MLALIAALLIQTIGARADEPVPSFTQATSVHIFDTRSYQGKEFYVNDHTFIQGEDGRWHLYGIFHQNGPFPHLETEFVHGVTSEPDPSKWGAHPFRFSPINNGIALTYAPELGETHIWAPHVIHAGDRYLMFYQSGGNDDDNNRAQIRLAQSKDLDHWERVGARPLFEDICVARDPMVMQAGNSWTLYYTRCDDVNRQYSGVAYRTSLDLVHWSDPRMALTLKSTPPMFNSGYTESPFVFKKDGWYYLSVTSYPIEWDGTFLYRSRDPHSFVDTPIARLTAHAGEWIFSGNKAFLSHAGPGGQGVWLSEVLGF